MYKSLDKFFPYFKALNNTDGLMILDLYDVKGIKYPSINIGFE